MHCSGDAVENVQAVVRMVREFRLEQAMLNRLCCCWPDGTPETVEQIPILAQRGERKAAAAGGD